ncbi:unnamed protein product [Cuscuta epithymum]|uniref:Uncharacterized protein n=1 Tax=Cuscuta epithymum TaxID=186058 RepID=A0AAV0D171_9ASTE|nr:unnamed protein product [Cuscuta epithymum]
MVEDMEMLRAQVAALEERLKVMEERMNAGSVAEVDVDVHHKSTKVEGKHDEDEDKDERKEGQVADEGNEAEVQDERQGVAHGVEDEKHEEVSLIVFPTIEQVSSFHTVLNCLSFLAFCLYHIFFVWLPVL